MVFDGFLAVFGVFGGVISLRQGLSDKLLAEKKIEEALKSGVTALQPLPTSPKGEESEPIQKMIPQNSRFMQTKFSPLGEMPEGQRGPHGA